MDSNNSGTPKIAIIFFTLFVSGLTFILGLGIGRQVTLSSNAESADGGTITNYTLIGNLNPPEVIEQEVDFNRFWEVWEKMQNDYIDESLDQQAMVDAAIKGMVEAVGDSVTFYYTAEETAAYEQASAGNFEGIGAELGYSDGVVIVKNPLEGSPALEAGLQRDDIIVTVDGEDITDLTISEVVLKIKGPKGTDVVIGVLRDGEKDVREITITRDEIHIESIEVTDEKDDVVVVRMNRFTESSYEAFALRWDEVVDDVLSRNPKGVIIDLRGNPGGFLSGGVYTAGEFLDKGDVVLYVEDRDGISDTLRSSRNGELRDIPVVVIVNEDSASASEIFAGALRYHKRATIIGMSTVGKGTAQEVYKPVEWEGASLHLTVQKWLLPDKTWLNPDNPIVPDVEVDLTEEDFQAGRDPQMDKAYEVINEKTN